MRKLLAVLALAVAMPMMGLADSYSNTLRDWENFIYNNKLGSSPDYWLEKNTHVGWTKVVLIMGYGSDKRSCEIIAGLLREKYTAAQYRCESANNP